MINQPHYTSIPDTSDWAHWQLKTDDAGNLLQRFVPIDPQLHRQLKAQAWKAIQLILGCVYRTATAGPRSVNTPIVSLL